MSTFEPATDQLKVELDGRVAIMTLNRPDARNALSPEISAGLIEGLKWVANEPAVGALVLTGAGSAFCSGGDVKAMGQSRTGPAPSFEAQFQELLARHRGVGGALYALRKPTIAALPGAAAGAGMAIALACDLRVAADTAFLTTGYAGIGLSGDYGVAWLLTRVVGPARARELMLTLERVRADRALEIGLVNRVMPGDQLMAETMTLAHQLADGPSIAFAYIKDNLDEALSIDHGTAIEREADRLLKARSTRDYREAVKAFAEKRRPEFKGE